MSREWNGTTDIIQYGSASPLDDLAISSAFSVHAWIKPKTTGEAGTGRIGDKRTSDSAGGWIFFTDPTASIGFITLASGGGVEANQRGADNQCPLNIFHSVVVTYDDSGDRKGHIYVDGVEISYATDTAASGTNGVDAAGNLNVGNSVGTIRTFDGDICEFALWDRILTAAEIASLADAFSPRFFLKNLLVYAPLVRETIDHFGNPATVTGTIVTPHPRIIYPRPPTIIVPTVAPPATSDTTRLPDGEGTGIAWIPKGGGDNFVEVDEGVAAADDADTEVTENTNGADADHYTMEDMPSDFDKAIEVTNKLRAFQTGRVDDITEIRIIITDVTEVSQIILGDAHNLDAITSYTTLTDASPIANTDNKAAWDTYRFRLVKNKTASGMPDAVTFSCTALEVFIKYDVAAAAALPPGLGPSLLRELDIAPHMAVAR